MVKGEIDRCGESHVVDAQPMNGEGLFDDILLPVSESGVDLPGENRVDLLPLYARLPQTEQQRIFQPQPGKRRIIFATNVAESSLTVPGIRSRIDARTEATPI